MEARGAMKMSSLQVCLDGSNLEAEGGARSVMAKKRNVKHTDKAGLRGPGLEMMVQRRCKSEGKMGRHHKLREGFHGYVRHTEHGRHLEGLLVQSV